MIFIEMIRHLMYCDNICVEPLRWILSDWSGSRESPIDPSSIAMLWELRASSVVDPVSRTISRRSARVKGVSPVTIITRDAKRCTHNAGTYVHTRTQSKFSSEVMPAENEERKKEREGITKSRMRETRESSGKPATVLDGRRAHTLTITPTFREPPPDTYLTFLVTGSST